MQQCNPRLSGKVQSWLVGLGGLLVVGCAETEAEHPALYNYGATPSISTTVEPCAQPNTGCPCENPGEVLDCGRVTIKVDGYENCYGASRICLDDKVLGPCVPDQTIAVMERKP